MFKYVWFKGARISFEKWMIYSSSHTIMVSKDSIFWRMANNADLTELVK